MQLYNIILYNNYCQYGIIVKAYAGDNIGRVDNNYYNWLLFSNDPNAYCGMEGK